MKRYSFLLCCTLLILLTLSACAGKGTGDEPVNAAPDTVRVESQSEKNTPDKAAVTGEEEKQAAPDGNEVNKDNKDKDVVKTTGSQETKNEIPGKKTDLSEANKDTNKIQVSKEQVQPEPAGDKLDKVTLWVTRDFGNNSILNKKVVLKKDWSVFDVLERTTRITTSHGGSFIESINGIESKSGGFGGEQKAWLYYVNGIFADVGVLDYYPQPGDVIWWDYHGWQRMSMFPAVIGCYPEPFLHGYREKAKPTVILSSEDDRALAGNLQKALKAKGVASVSIKNLDNQLLQDRQGPTIVIGEWSQLSQIEWFNGLNKAYRKNGTSVHFTGDGVELLDYRGQVVHKIDKSAGVIAATGEGSGDDSPLWLVVGTGREGLQQAVEVLVNSPGKISGMYNAAIAGGEIIRLPLQ